MIIQGNYVWYTQIYEDTYMKSQSRVKMLIILIRYFSYPNSHRKLFKYNNNMISYTWNIVSYHS